MLEIIIGIVILAAAGFIQVSFFGQIRLLNGTTDLVMLCMIAWSINDRTKYSWIQAIAAGLIMSYLSAMPMNGYIWMYGAVWILIHFIRQRVWQMPLILMLFVTIIGTILVAIGTLVLLYLQNASVNYMDAFRQIVIPSLVMNLLLSIPIYAFLNDVVNTIYIREVTE